MRRYPKLYIYLGHLNLAVWRCYISFLFRWNGSDVLLYGGLHTYSFVYVVDPFACRLRRPFLSRCLEMVGTAERSTCEWHLAPPYYFNHFRSSRLESRSVIHRGSYIVFHFTCRNTFCNFTRKPVSVSSEINSCACYSFRHETFAPNGCQCLLSVSPYGSRIMRT